MLNTYENPDPRLRPYLDRARQERARLVRAVFRATARPFAVAWRRVLLRRDQRRATAELNALSDAALKDIGLARGEINSVVNAWQGAISVATVTPHTYASGPDASVREPDPTRRRRPLRSPRKPQPQPQPKKRRNRNRRKPALGELGYGAGILLPPKRQRLAIPHAHVSEPATIPNTGRGAGALHAKAEQGVQPAPVGEPGYGAGVVLSSKRQRSAMTQAGQSGRLALQT